MDPVLLATTLILVFGVAGQFVGRLVGVPSLLVLLVLGAVLGPGLGWLDPSEAYGQDVVLTLASLGVGLLLFEGGLQLRWSEFDTGIRRPLVLLITLGVLLTVAAGTVLSLWVLDVSATQALLLGAILSVSGPTVIGPLIRAAKPREPAGMLLRWEGILIDPIGAMLSVTVLSVWFVVEEPNGVVGFLRASTGGIVVGLVCAAALVLLLRLGTPDDLEVPIILATAITAYALGEWWHSESGLFATTALGVTLANQRVVGIRAAEVFSGVISVLVLGALLITLVSEVDLGAVGDFIPEIAIICAGLLVTRQIVVHVCAAHGRPIDEPQRLFMGLMAPRGVVAAATAASFSLKLDDRDLGFPELVAVTYGVIIGMGVLACLTIPAAGWLGVRRLQRRGLLLIGSEDWTAQLASAIAAAGVTVYLLAPGRGDIDEVQQVRLEPRTLDDLLTTPVLDEVEYCLIGPGSIEMRGFAWTLASERIGRRRCLVLPKPGTPPGVSTIWADIPADSLRSSSFLARPAGRPDEPTLGEIRLVRVGLDGSLDFDPYRPHEAVDGWLVVARPRVGVRMSGADPAQRPQARRP